MHHYYNIDVRITIANKIQFNVVKSIRIENTIEKFSDTAKIELPREFKNAKKQNGRLSIANKNLLEIIKVGDTIKIEAGYNGDLKTEFEGYITEIGAEIPLLIECEDEMYKLKQMPQISKTFALVTLKELIQFIAPNYTIEAIDMPLGKFMVENANPYKIIEELKQQYGVRCYFDGKVLKAGLSIDFKPQQKHQFVFGRNIRKSSALKYLTKEQRDRYYKAVSIQKRTSKKITFEYGNVDAEHRSLHLPCNLSIHQVKTETKKIYHNYVFDGYEGSIDSWAIPKTKAGDSAEIIDPNYNDKHRDMQLFIESVITTIDGSNGIKRQNKLSFKIN